MQKVASFEKVSFEEFYKSISACFATVEADEKIKAAYEAIKLPSRATIGSAGYDFFAPFGFCLTPNSSITLPTGIRAKIAEGWVLGLYPRSGLGFKFRLQLDNTVGIIDSDYYYSENEGHILVRLSNLSLDGKEVKVKAGDGVIQGMFTPFGITDEDNVTALRNGGFGSTNV